jgi:hypothetical protein
MFRFAVAVAVAVMTMAVAASAQTAISPAKEKLVQRVLQLWHVENVGLLMLQEPVAESLRQSRSLMQGRASTERQEAAMKDINEDARKFFEEATPVVSASAQKLIPSTVAPLLAEKFTEEELRQIIAILESPVKSKFEALIPQMQKALGEKIAADTAAKINPKLEDLKQRIGLRMRAAITP